MSAVKDNRKQGLNVFKIRSIVRRQRRFLNHAIRLNRSPPTQKSHLEQLSFCKLVFNREVKQSDPMICYSLTASNNLRFRLTPKWALNMVDINAPNLLRYLQFILSNLGILSSGIDPLSQLMLKMMSTSLMVWAVYIQLKTAVQIKFASVILVLDIGALHQS